MENNPYEEFCNYCIENDTTIQDNHKQIRGAFPWMGGKCQPHIQKAILAALPPHKYYIEPFGGAGNILLNKKAVKCETYNDINHCIVNFFRVLINENKFNSFFACVRNMPYSRELFTEYKNTYEKVEDDVKQAIQFYMVARQSFGGMIESKCWGFSCKDTSMTQKYISGFENLLRVRNRLQQVQIENADWRVCLKRYCGPGYLAYCDPPYVTSTRRNANYKNEMTDNDHRELIDALLAYNGAVVLSGYDNEIYAPLERNGWHKVQIEHFCSCATKSRYSLYNGIGNSREACARQECIWSNPETLKRIQENTLF